MSRWKGYENASPRVKHAIEDDIRESLNRMLYLLLHDMELKGIELLEFNAKMLGVFFEFLQKYEEDHEANVACQERDTHPE